MLLLCAVIRRTNSHLVRVQQPQSEIGVELQLIYKRRSISVLTSQTHSDQAGEPCEYDVSSRHS